MLATAPALAASTQDDAKSIFLRCDGRTGHVSGGETFLRLLLITATAGLSEDAMSKDNADKRAKGVAGANACDQALAVEKDSYRRVQLALAKSIHLGEDSRWAEAAAAAATVPALIGQKAGDWGLAKSARSTASYLEGLYRIRAGDVAQGEEAAWSGARQAGMDVLALQRAMRFIGLSRRLSDNQRAVLDSALRYYPDSTGLIARTYAEAGDYATAATTLRGALSSFNLFLDKPIDMSGTRAQLATLAALDGNLAGAKSELATAKQVLATERAEGDSASDPSNFAMREELIAFAEAAIVAAEGDSLAAARLLAARGSWPAVAPGVVAALVDRIAPAIPAEQRQGVVAKGGDAIWAEAHDARLALLKKTEGDEKLWGVTGVLQQAVNYQRLAKPALTGSAKPRWLIKPDKKSKRSYDILALTPGGQWEGGEALFYHAALIAKARGKRGFVVMPLRKNIDIMSVRFGDPSELGVPETSMVAADDVIAALAPRIAVAER